MTPPRELPPFETSIRPELIDALCQVAGAPFPIQGMTGRRMMSINLDAPLAHYFHLEAKRQMGLVRARQRFGGRITASSLLCEAMTARLPLPDDYTRLAEANARSREVFGEIEISVRVPIPIRERLEALAETLPARKGIGFMSPKALAEVLALAWAGGNDENPFGVRPAGNAALAPPDRKAPVSATRARVTPDALKQALKRGPAAGKAAQKTKATAPKATNKTDKSKPKPKKH